MEPGLRQLFLDAVGVVREDLKQIAPMTESGLRTLPLPVANMEAWIHALAQARLAITARHGFTERELDGEVPLERGPRAFALLQMDFYGSLEGYLLEQLD